MVVDTVTTATPVRVLVVLGTRPEAIKLAPVIRRLRARPDRFATTVCSTGQHRELATRTLLGFGLRPDHDLDVMRHAQSNAAIAARVLDGLSPLLDHTRPDWVVVQGDTTTVAAAALAAFDRETHLAHVEAGLRTHSLAAPFPEELHRRLVAITARLHFAPTAQARQNLLSEGVAPERVVLTGNTIVDTLACLSDAHADAADTPDSPPPAHSPFVLVTVHRRENHGPALQRVCTAVSRLIMAHPDTRVLWPLHPHPAVRECVRARLGEHPSVHLLDPLDHADMVALCRRARCVLTDSGGLQEEAATLGTPLVILRERTERPEAVLAGRAFLAGTSPPRILHALRRALALPPVVGLSRLYGDGRAAERIAACLAGEAPEALEVA